MGVAKTPQGQKSSILGTPKKGKTPNKNISPKSKTPIQTPAKAKSVPSIQVTTPGGSQNVLKTPKSGKKNVGNTNGDSLKHTVKTHLQMATPGKTPKSLKKEKNDLQNNVKTILQASPLKSNKKKSPKLPNINTNEANLINSPKNTENPSKKRGSRKRKSSLNNSEDNKLKPFAGTGTLNNAGGDTATSAKMRRLNKKKEKGSKKQTHTSNLVNRTSTDNKNSRIKHRLKSKVRKLNYKIKLLEVKKQAGENVHSEIEKIKNVRDATLLRIDGILTVKLGDTEKVTNKKNTNLVSKKTAQIEKSKNVKKEQTKILPIKKENLKKMQSKVKNDVEDDSEEEENDVEGDNSDEEVENEDVAEMDVSQEDSEEVGASDEEDSDEEDEEVSDNSEAEDSDEEENSDYEVEKTVKAGKVTKTLKYDPEQADADITKKGDKKGQIKDTGKKSNKKPKQSNIDAGSLRKEDVIEKGKSRYVVFVGNIPFTADQNEIRKHFQSVGDITSVRIPKGENNKPRGFAYVELANAETYEKALSLHQSSLGGRRINVSYTMSGKKNSEDKKNVIKSKNLKLHAMRKSGMLAGSKKDSNKRSARRAKAKNGKDAAMKTEA